MKLNQKQKDTFFRLFIFSTIQIFCIYIYIIISALSGDFNWTYERLRSSFLGMVIQILNLILLINGVIIFMYIVILILLVKH
ncbi:unnamed protein product [marine sediment metagenome]|uniref:Uncharacterized protein n=1 Tax=marine sediment metagenome TaxID=412755 RepID=X1SY21_9ZZZZ